MPLKNCPVLSRPFDDSLEQRITAIRHSNQSVQRSAISSLKGCRYFYENIYATDHENKKETFAVKLTGNGRHYSYCTFNGLS